MFLESQCLLRRFSQKQHSCIRLKANTTDDQLQFSTSQGCLSDTVRSCELASSALVWNMLPMKVAATASVKRRSIYALVRLRRSVSRLREEEASCCLSSVDSEHGQRPMGRSDSGRVCLLSAAAGSVAADSSRQAPKTVLSMRDVFCHPGSAAVSVF